MGTLVESSSRHPVIRFVNNFSTASSQKTVNRSPLDSPPLIKRSSMMKPQENNNNNNGTVASPGDKENGCKSILKRPQRVAAVLATANELGGAGAGGPRTRSWPGSLRRVNFEQSVDVVVYDKSDGEFVCAESRQLNNEPSRDRRLFLGRPPTATLVRSHHPQSPLAKKDLSPPAQRRPLPAGPAGAPPTQPDQSELDFAFFEDPVGQLRLKFAVPLGAGVAAGDALVKANVAGNKIRVIGTRTLAPSGKPEEFSWRYSLPMDVDPYAISARMDSAGNLFVEAPVMTNTRRRTVCQADKINGKLASA